MNFFYYCFFFSLLILSGCTKDEFDIQESAIDVVSGELSGSTPSIYDNIIEKIHTHDFAEGQEEFDWENLQYLPLPSWSNTVPTPWNTTATVKYSEDIRNDYKRENGWELYSANFSKHFRQGNLTFSLYNKYRGLLRYYFYIESGTQNVQDFNILRHVFISNILIANFVNQQIIDIDRTDAVSFSLEPQTLSDASWYAVEYELAYDKNIYDRSTEVQFACSFGMAKKYFLFVNGQTMNELNSKIRVYGQLDDNLSSDKASMNFYGPNDLEKISTSNTLSITELNNLNDIISVNSTNNLLNGVLHDGLQSNLKWNTSIAFNLYPNGVGLLNESFYVSGADLSVVQGLAPFYNRALGVFYLNKNPVCSHTTHPEDDHPYQYMLDVSSVEYIFNPVILEIAEIKNLKQELVATEKESLMEDNKSATMFFGQLLKSNKPLYIQGVRVSFDVVPNNGTEKVHIVKTFKANIQQD